MANQRERRNALQAFNQVVNQVIIQDANNVANHPAIKWTEIFTR